MPDDLLAARCADLATPVMELMAAALGAQTKADSAFADVIRLAQEVVVDDLRLDYVPDEGSNPFTEALAAGDDRFGFLVFAPSQPDVITVPFDPNFATPGVQHGQPFSGNGFLLNQDNVFRPEFEVPQGTRMPLTSGAQLWQTIDGVPSLVAVFDALAGFVRV